MNDKKNIRYYSKTVNQHLKRFKNVNPISKDSYPFIPLETSLLKPISQFQNQFFLDIGCATGSILQYAKSCGHQPYGIEYNSAYKEVLKQYNHLIVDLNDVNPIFYSQFDFIYSYLPIKRDLFKVFLETKLIPNMSNGAILYTPHFEIENEHLTKIGLFLYRVGHKI